MSTARKILYAIITSGASVLVLLVLLEGVCRLLPVRNPAAAEPVNAQHQLLELEPERQFVYSKGWNLDMVNRGRTNNIGFVNDQDYDSTAHTPLVSVIGDSQVEAMMVPYAQTMQGRMARVAHGARVYSFGVSGAPLSHYLAEAIYAHNTFRANAYVFAIIANDFDESLMKYKNQPGLQLYRDSAGTLVLTRTDYNPNTNEHTLRRLLRSSALVRYLYYDAGVGDLLVTHATEGMYKGIKGTQNHPLYVGNVLASTDSTRVADSKKAVDAFLRDIPRAGIAPDSVIFVVDSHRMGLYDARQRALYPGSYFDVMRTYFIAQARAHGYNVIDLDPVFAADYQRRHQRFDFDIDMHWNGLGHEVITNELLKRPLIQHVLGIAPATTRTMASTTGTPHTASSAQ